MILTELCRVDKALFLYPESRALTLSSASGWRYQEHRFHLPSGLRKARECGRTPVEGIPTTLPTEQGHSSLSGL